MATTIEEFKKAVRRLEDALSQPKDEFVRDSVIQRFEFCVELAWKTAKKLMASSSVAPKVVIREMAAQKLIDNPDRWFDYLEGRNLSSHTYNESLAEQIYNLAKSSLSDFKILLKNLEGIK